MVRRFYRSRAGDPEAWPGVPLIVQLSWTGLLRQNGKQYKFRQEHPVRALLPLAVCVSLIAMPTVAAVAADPAEKREYIYGAELMSAPERDAYRRGLGQAQSEEARAEHRKRHRQRLQKRAQQRGVPLDEQGVVLQQGRGR
jgi:hypothetical protein